MIFLYPFSKGVSARRRGLERRWFALFFAAALTCSCSKSDDTPADPVPPQDPDAPHTVVVSAGSNLPVAGTLTAQYSEYTEENDVGKVADGDPQTAYKTDRSRFYIVYAASEPVVIDHYSLTTGSGTRSTDPYSWRLSASNDNETWRQMDKQSYVLFNTRYNTLKFAFDNDTAYKYYRLDVDGNGGGSYTQIGEWRLASGSLDPTQPATIKVQRTINMLSSSGSLTSQYSDSPRDADVGKLLDGNPQTSFQTSHDRFYIVWDPDTKSYGNRYSLTASDHAQSAPRSWKLYGSVNRSDWELLDEQSDQQFEAGETKSFFCRRITDYRSYTHYISYRLEIEGNGGAEFTQLAEWSLQYECRDLGDCLYLAENFKYSDKTPMGVEYEGIPATSQEILDRLADPEVEPDITDYGENLYWNGDIEVDLYPFGTPLPTDVNQHQIGNCSVLAMYASLAYQYPEYIRSIIRENADGSYTVKMFDPQGKPVDVCVKATLVHPEDWRENPTWKYGVSGKNDATTWSSIIEKAMMKWESVFALYDSGANLGGMNASTTSPLFTGNGAGFSLPVGKLTSQQLTIAVKEAMARGMIVTGGFSTENWTEDGWTTTGHTWTAVAANNPSALFALRNPWGSCADADEKKDGVLNVFDNPTIVSTVGIDIYMPGAALDYYQANGLPVGRTAIYDIPVW